MAQTISKVVEIIVKEKPFLEIALQKGIINYSKLAHEILPEVEGKLFDKRTVTHSSIMMALRRLATKLNKSVEELFDIRFLNTQLSIEYGLFEITLDSTKTNFKKVQQLYSMINFAKGEFLTFTQGRYEITVISFEGYLNSIMNIFEEDEITKLIKDLASITIKLPEEAIETPGLFYNITKELYWENINIVEIVSTYREMTLIMDYYDADKAMPILRQLLKRYQK